MNNEPIQGSPLWQLQENLKSKLSIQKTLDDDMKKLNERIAKLNSEIEEYRNVIAYLNNEKL